MTNCSHEIHLRAWNALLSQRQDFVSNHPARVPTTPNEQGTMEIRVEVFSSVGAQDLDTSGYQVSKLEDIDFLCEDPDLNMNAVIDTIFSNSTFKVFKTGSMTENPVLIDEEQDKVNYPTLPRTPIS